MESTQEADKGGKKCIGKVACNEEDEDADTVHPPLIPLCLRLPFEGRPEVGKVEDDDEICDDCTGADSDNDDARGSGKCEYKVWRIILICVVTFERRESSAFRAAGRKAGGVQGVSSVWRGRICEVT